MTFDTGSTGFMLVATSLVMLMTPGLAFFYGGLVGRKNVLAIMIQSFVSMGVTTVIWFAFGYSLCFSGGEGAIIGDLRYMFLQRRQPHNGVRGIQQYPHLGFHGISDDVCPDHSRPHHRSIQQQGPVSAYLIFLVLWLVFVYFPFAHMVWGGGLLAKWGVLDFAGGSSSMPAPGSPLWRCVFFVGKRRVQDKGPHSIPLVALGTGLLWFGWYGFNAGSELRVDAITALAFINTDVAASFAAITWLIVAWTFEKKPKFVGLLTGSIAGLAAVTPAAGYVSTASAVTIGIVASIVCYFAISMKNRLHWDDALDVWGVHGVGGFLGVIALGLFADLTMNPSGSDGLLAGELRVLLQGDGRCSPGGPVFVPVHVCHALDDQQGDSGEGESRRRGSRTRRERAGRAGIFVEKHSMS
jgi:Amt family ammonium transporter